MDLAPQFYLAGLSISEIDALIERARQLRAWRVQHEASVERVRKEIFSRIAQSGYSLEEIFDGTGRFPVHLLKRIAARAEKRAKN